MGCNRGSGPKVATEACSGVRLIPARVGLSDLVEDAPFSTRLAGERRRWRFDRSYIGGKGKKRPPNRHRCNPAIQQLSQSLDHYVDLEERSTRKAQLVALH